MDLYNKVALITGGARIGIIIAEELGRKGCHVALSYRSSKEQADEAARKVEAFGSNALVVKGDMTKEKDVKAVMKAVQRELGGLDILINMASVYRSTNWKQMNSQVWDENIASNLSSAYLASFYAAKLFSKKEGRIINFADWVAESGRPRYEEFVAYYTAKKGVIGLTEALALELAPRILVNAIAPGPILPPVGATSRDRNNVKNATPLRRWGGPLEIAKAVIFLIETDFVTGECIRVDGGRHLS